MIACTETCPAEDRTRSRLPRPILAPTVCVVLALAGAPMAVGAEETVPRKKLDTLLANALTFVRSQQTPQGGFGAVQPQLQTSLAVLAILSRTSDLSPDDTARVERALDYLIRAGSPSGDLGDAVFRTESHALATTALLCAIPRVRDPALRKRALKTVHLALRHTQRIQDRSRSSASRGGWKMEGRQGRENDRRASSWALLSYYTALQYGLPIKQANIDRGAHYLLGSLKRSAENPSQVGGLSVDTEGLAVASTSAMGGWAISRLVPKHAGRRENLAWLTRHPPIWSGPNYFYTNFFRVRVLRFADPGGPALARCLRRLYLQIADHQDADGSIGFPPGNAQNTVAMGPTFSTSLAILILGAESSRLPFDQDHRPASLF